MTALIDNLLNRITMYRLVLYYLVALVAIAGVFGALGIIHYSPAALAFSTALLLAVSFITNKLFAYVFGAQPNVESVYITALILALIITPAVPGDLAHVSFLIWAAVWAMASKYVLAAGRKHFFNPAAFAVALTAFTISRSASWWIGGNAPMMAFVVIGGLLVTRKIQRFDLVAAFLAAAGAAIVATAGAGDPLASLQKAVLHAPIFFFAFVMLTEPLTTPPTRPLRIAYGALVGFLFAPNIHMGPVYSTPELALLVGNVFSYLVSPKRKYFFTLKQKSDTGGGIFDFVFASERAVAYRPGQYMEWTLGHTGGDSRGNRRYFTLASSPTEPDVRLGVRFYDPPSSFKKALRALAPGDAIVGGTLAGDFTLPHDRRKKLVFIAGGIGITPFRSMVKYLSDRGEQRDIILLYSNRTAKDIAYREVFDAAARTIGLRTVYAITDPGETLPANGWMGRIDEELIRRIPDYRDRTFYISGTHAMTSDMERMLRAMGIPQSGIKIDFFPGFT